MAKLRAFIAVELDEAFRRALGEVQAQVRAAVDLPVRWVEPEKAHLTLKFLGDIDEGQVEAIVSAMADIASQAQPLTVALGDVGGFPTLARPRVLWVGLRGDVGPLTDLQQALERRLESLGFTAEGRPFAPHLTLGRVRGGDRSRHLEEAAGLAADAPTAEAVQRVDRISLMQSTLRAQGPEYRSLRSVILGSELSVP